MLLTREIQEIKERGEQVPRVMQGMEDGCASRAGVWRVSLLLGMMRMVRCIIYLVPDKG